MFLARPRAAHCAILGRLAYTNTRDTSQRSLTAHVLGKVTVAALDQALIPKPVAYLQCLCDLLRPCRGKPSEYVQKVFPIIIVPMYHDDPISLRAKLTQYRSGLAGVMRSNRAPSCSMQGFKFKPHAVESTYNSTAPPRDLAGGGQASW